MHRFCLSMAFLAATTPSLAADSAAGDALFKRHCLICHSIGEGAKNKVGPVLNGLFGRPAGSIPGFAYSTANKSSGITWTQETFGKYIRDPKAAIPGTKMVFVGLKTDEEIANMTAYLAQFGPDGKKAP